MIIHTIINLLIVIFGSLITILTGILFIKHRQFIAYFKDAFTFIKSDYQAVQDIQYDNVFSQLASVFKYGIKSMGKSNSQDALVKDRSNEINHILVLIGKVLIVTGLLGILASIAAGFMAN
jgi:hypothetical protein